MSRRLNENENAEARVYDTGNMWWYGFDNGQGVVYSWGVESIQETPTQLELGWRDEDSLRTELEERTGLRIRLVVTDNTSTVMSVKHDRSDRSAVLRVHHMFLGAAPEIVGALATWLRQPGRRTSGTKIDQFIRENNHLIRERKPRVQSMVTLGRFFDLRALFAEVNQEHFDGTVTAGICWGRYPSTRRRRRSIRFGSYSPGPHLIRVHPLLDQEFVPRYFVRYIVFHEMLHARLGLVESASGRTLSHTREFNRVERAYAGFQRAEAWQRNAANLRKLLR